MFRILTTSNNNRFQLLDTRLGKGAYGTVRLGMHLKEDQAPAPVAVKKFTREQDFKQELENLHQAKGVEGALTYIDSTSAFGRKYRQETKERKWYLFTPYMAKGDGIKFSQQLNKQSLEQRLHTLLPVAEALLTQLLQLHQKYQYHLDIKPDNFLISKNQEVKLSDFGCAREATDGKIPPVSSDGRYMSPQKIDMIRYLWENSPQKLPYEVTLRSAYNKTKTPSEAYFWGHSEDAWALGVTFVELLIGANPFVMGINNLPPLRNESDRLNKGSEAHFQAVVDAVLKQYSCFHTQKDHPIIAVIKGLLTVNEAERMSIVEALQVVHSQPTLKSQIASEEYNGAQSSSHGLGYNSPPKFGGKGGQYPQAL